MTFRVLEGIIFLLRDLTFNHCLLINVGSTDVTFFYGGVFMLKKHTMALSLVLFAIAVGIGAVGCGGGGGGSSSTTDTTTGGTTGGGTTGGGTTGGGTTGGGSGTTVSLTGMLFKMEGTSTLLPLSGADIAIGTASSTTNSSGIFAVNVSPSATALVTVDAPNYTEASATVDLSTATTLYLFLQQLDANSVELIASASKSQKAAPKVITSSDGSTSITVESMSLTQDIAVSVTPYTNPNVPPAVNSEDHGVTGTVCGGADVSFVRSDNGKKATLEEIGWNTTDTTKNMITPRTSKVLGDKDAETLNNLASQGLVTLSLWYYDMTDNSDKTWTKAGDAQVEFNPTANGGNGSYSLAAASGVYIHVLYPFVFAYESVIVDPTITITGTVKDTSDNAIENALVFANETFVMSGTDGAYSITLTIPFDSPSVSLLVKAEGFFEEYEIVTVENNVTDYSLNFALAPISTTATVTGTVTNSATGAPIEGAIVTMKNPSVLTSVESIDYTTDGGDVVTGVAVGMNPDTHYYWEFKKPDETTWVNIKHGMGTESMNYVMNDELLAAVLLNYATADFSGIYDLQVTAIDESVTLTEVSQGSFEVIFDKSKINMTGSLTANLSMVNIWGGQNVGFFFATAGQGATFTWTASLHGTFAGVTANGTDSAGLDTYYIVPATTVSSGDLIFYNALTNFVTDNFGAIIQEFTPGTSYLEDTLTLSFGVTAAWTLNSLPFEGTATADIDLQGDPTTMVLVKNIYLPASGINTAVMTAVTDANGVYTFEDVDPILSGLLTIKAQADDFSPSATEAVGALAAAQSVTVNFALDPIVTAVTYDWDFEADASDWDASGLWHTVTNPNSIAVLPYVVSTLVEFPDEPKIDKNFVVLSITNNYGYGDLTLDTDSDSTADAWGYVYDWNYDNAFTLDDTIYLSDSQGSNELPISTFTDTNANGTIDAGDVLVVTITDTSSTAAVTLLAPSTGTTVFWYGEDATGTFLGADTPLYAGDGTLDTAETSALQYSNYANNGGTSPSGGNEGYLTSPLIDLTEFANAKLAFKSWFETESVDCAGGQYDQMYVQVRVVDDAGTVDIYSDTNNYTISTATSIYPDAGWSTLFNLNPESEPPYGGQVPYTNYSSGGVDAVPMWLNYSVNLDPFAGHVIQVRFYFTSNDGLYNGYRGWTIDNVQVLNEEPGVKFTFTEYDSWYYKTGSYFKSAETYGAKMKAKSSRGGK